MIFASFTFVDDNLYTWFDLFRQIQEVVFSEDHGIYQIVKTHHHRQIFNLFAKETEFDIGRF